jgi:pentatricopeptide repeat protein
MNTKIISCSSIVEAHALNNRLADAGIVSIINDGPGDWVIHRVPNMIVNVMVRDEDYEQARAIYKEMSQTD